MVSAAGSGSNVMFVTLGIRGGGTILQTNLRGGLEDQGTNRPLAGTIKPVQFRPSAPSGRFGETKEKVQASSRAASSAAVTATPVATTPVATTESTTMPATESTCVPTTESAARPEAAAASSES